MKSILSKKKKAALQLSFGVVSFVISAIWPNLVHYLSGIGIFIFDKSMPIGVQQIFVFMISLLFSIWVTNIAIQDRLEELVEDLPDKIRNPIQLPRTGIRSMGKMSPLIVNFFNERLEGAAVVLNTCVATRKDINNMMFSDDLREGMLKFINDGGHWTDFITENMSSRSKEIRREIHHNKRYDVHVSAIEFPIINFVIVEYLEKPPFILFGFGLHESDPDGHVYFSSDEKIVQTFSKYYESLRAGSYSYKLW